MKSLLLVVAILCLATSGSVARGQQPDGPEDLSAEGRSADSQQLTPEMWYYQQEQDRYDDPQQMVRLSAQRRASERQSRIAAMKWYGVSKSRPRVSTTWSMNTYNQPSWGVYGFGVNNVRHRWTNLWR